ncbi:dienelactone hydrolase family protein [Xylophilus rhododendri]|uniref:Dienelactone hydrolase family protein n=1 Tax=Xylophilus rhododendri TaxID=2697032 RepID=A0A857J8W3_9BURK|nr:dienelactone hydrolase family protein [Xylophilus rhododendri]QHI99489.1 dienelactone hydrolase family protein [Xylophilus rhododendri]
MTCTATTIPTRDGACPAWLLTPAAEGRWPGVIFYADAGGIRPAMVEMAQMLADMGYAVLLPDPYYRYGAYGPLVPREVFAGDVGAILGPLMATTGNDKAAQDCEAFLAFMEGHDAVAQGPLGAVGFCMGGGMAISAAATHTDRFAAVASFHGGNLATDAPTSPHRIAGQLKAELYLAAADQDGSYPPEMAERFEQALAEGGVHYRAETYAGAAHGWMVTDFPVYDPAGAARGWSALRALFEQKLRA